MAKIEINTEDGLSTEDVCEMLEKVHDAILFNLGERNHNLLEMSPAAGLHHLAMLAAIETAKANAGLCDLALTNTVVEMGSERVRFLLQE